MNAWAQTGLVVLGGAISAGTGWWLDFRRHGRERREDAEAKQREAAIELAEALLPLMLFLERSLEKSGYWVGNFRELRRIGTWTNEPSRNAHDPPDWPAITALALKAERPWWNKFQWRIKDPELRKLREEFYEAAVLVGLPSSDIMLAATRLSDCVEATLNRIAQLTGADLRIAQDKPPRPSAPDRPNPYRQPPAAT